jgi:tetratricopeptide (TPR) repeat protein
VTFDLPAPVAPSYKFNPGFQTDAEAISSFVVRRKELDAVIETICSNSEAARNVHVLITAPRGAGKTTLVRRALAEVRTNDKLNRSWFPIFLGEESYTITTPGEFFLECLFHLKDELKDPKWQRAYFEAKSQSDETSLANTALAALRRFATQEGKRLLLIVENLHMIINEQIGIEANRLQRLLDDEPVFMMLATSVRDAADAENEHLSLLSQYRTIPLQPLSLEECRQLWEALTHQDVKPERIRPLQILTGGSPRLMRIMAEFTVAPSLQNLLENLNLLIDQNTEYFKSQLDNLPPTERKVFAALLDIWDPSTAKEVADSARVNVNIASAMLGRLTDRGSVVKLPGKGRAATYHAAERLFNIYYLMRRRSHPSSRVRALVTFMTQYYRGDELIDTTAKLVAEACALSPKNRQDYHFAFNAIIAQSSGEIREKILSQTPSDFLSSAIGSDDFRAAISTAVSGGMQENRLGRGSARRTSRSMHVSARTKLLDSVRSALQRADHVSVERIVDSAFQHDEHSADLWLDLALVLRGNEHLESAIKAARRAVLLASSQSMPHAVLAMILSDVADAATEVNRHVKTALEIDPENVLALTVAGDAMHSEEKFKEALKFYKRAWAAAPDFQLALTNLVSMLGHHLGRYAEAEELLRDALRKHPDWDNARNDLARLLAFRRREKEAEAILREGFSVDEKSPARWANLGQFLFHRSRDSRGAREALEKALDLGANRASVWSTYAQVLQSTGGSAEETLQAAKKGVELNSDSSEPWLALGDVYEQLGDVVEAERAYRKVIGLDGNSVRGWFELGMLLQKIPDRSSDAERALRNAHESSQTYPCAVPKELAALLIHKGNDKEAASLLQQAVAINKDCYCSLTLLAGVSSRNRDTSAAKTYFEQALTVNPDGITAMTGLAKLLIEQETEVTSAKKLIDRAMKANSEDARVFLASALLKKSQQSLADSLNDARRALVLDPDLVEAKLLLASVEAHSGEVNAALDHLTDAMRSLGRRRELLSGVVDAAVALAQRGEASAIVAAIQNAGVQELLEPLCVALQLAQGEKPRVAKEVLEVANDIFTRIVPIGLKGDLPVSA